MPRLFYAATAEQVVSVVEAVVVNRNPATVDSVADFSDLLRDRAEAALNLATDLNFLSLGGGRYTVVNQLSRFVSTPNQKQKAAVLRIVLESYEPFILFRERLVATNDATASAHQTKVTLELTAHREEVKDTLISLGTYSNALVTEGGGRYSPEYKSFENMLAVLAQACADTAAAEAKVREMIGNDAASMVSRTDVIVPLANALLRGRDRDARGAVVEAGNAVESFLVERASRLGVNITNATGLNSKVERFNNAQAGTNRLPTKIVNVGKYLGHIRNAADHGTDTDIGTAWTIRESTGLEYVFVACSFIATTSILERGGQPEI